MFGRQYEARVSSVRQLDGVREASTPDGVKLVRGGAGRGVKNGPTGPESKSRASVGTVADCLAQ